MAYINQLLYSPFFQNKFVLYGSLFLVLITIIRFLSNSNFNGIILLSLIGLLMTYFSKNMIIVLLTAVVSVTILDLLQVSGSIEGMKSSKEGSDTLKSDEPKKDKAVKPTKDGEKPKVESKENANDEEEPAKEDKEEPEDKEDKDKATSGSATDTTGSASGKGKKEKQGMTKMSPASYDGKDHDDHKTSNNGNRIDYASTLEQAYDNIENIIGEDGVRGLTDQTKSLMNQQKQLMENMKDMGPLLKSAEGFMKQITGGGGIEGITSMLKGFAPAKAT
jgi:hypothetical protein